MNTRSIPFNIMNLRDEGFYEFVSHYSGKKVAELLAFQECNSVDSFLGCNDVTAILHLESDQLHDIKKGMCISLNNGFISILPGIESAIANLIKVLKKKREELHKQAQRLQSIDFISTAPVYRTNSSISLSSDDKLADHVNHSSTSTIRQSSTSVQNSPLHINHVITDEMKNRISNIIIDWFKQNKEKLSLIDINFHDGIDFHIEFNNYQDGVIVKCNCGVKTTIAQNGGHLVVRISTINRSFFC